MGEEEGPRGDSECQIPSSSRLRRSVGWLQIQRLAQYEQSFVESVWSGVGRDVADRRWRGGAQAAAATTTVGAPPASSKELGEQQSDLERIQNLFPSDALCLHDKDGGGSSSHMGTALPRAVGAVPVRPRTSSWRAPLADTPCRRFIMESPVQFTTGLLSQERHIFLFNDLLLVAKARSGGHFKLKERVRVSDVWLSMGAIDELVEAPRSPDTSFIIGWPTTNIVATFGTKAARDQWLSILSEVIAAERDKEPASTNIQVVYYNPSTQVEYCKTFSIGPNDTARHCIRLALEHLGMDAISCGQNLDDLVDGFQLWAKSGCDRGNDGDSPYPLLGHERPFAIKLHCLRQALSTEEGFDLDHCNNLYGTDPLTRCQFLLRSKNVGIMVCPTEGKISSKKKNRKSPIRIRQVFRRSLSAKGEDRSGDGGSSNPGPRGHERNGRVLFGVPLNRVIDNQIPKPVKGMLMQVFLKGPSTQGIFRKSANARLVRELREKLDSGKDVDLDHIPVLTTAALLKEFFRSLPDPLLCAHLFPDWMSALGCRDINEKICRLKSVVDMLPAANFLLLQHFLCILRHISSRSRENLMSSLNLGVCVGPSLLWVPSLTPTSSRTVPALVTLLIDHCEALCGPHVVSLLGEAPERDATRLDSGAEESDSLHSGGGLRLDDSSIDSLERELLESSPPPRKDKMSLSRDSGLTMSDTQLYTPDEEDTGSTSGSGSGRALHPRFSPNYTPANSQFTSPPPSKVHYHNKVATSLSTPQSMVAPFGTTTEKIRSVMNILPEPKKYVRVYAGWDERMECFRKGCGDSVYAKPVARHTQSHSGQPHVINPNFQRQDWFRQRSQLKRVVSKQSGQTSSGSSTSSSSSSSGSSNRRREVEERGGGGTGGGVMVVLRRSASDESLPRAAFGSPLDVPTLRGKGRAPLPPLLPVDDGASFFGKGLPRRQSHPQGSMSSCVSKQNTRRHTSVGESPHHTQLARNLEERLAEPPFRSAVAIPRSKSAHHLPVPSSAASYPVAEGGGWARAAARGGRPSGGRPSGGEGADRSCDSSTLSDDDSTPHVSRSNSRGKDCHAAPATWDDLYGSVLQHSSSTGLPTYEETMTRRLGPQTEVVRAAPATTIDQCPDSDSESTGGERGPPPPPLPPKLRRGSGDGRWVPQPHAPVVGAAARLRAAAGRPLVEGERAGRAGRRDGGAAQRSKSLPPAGKSCGEGEGRPQAEGEGGRVEDAATTGCRCANASSPTVRSELREEISWSVSRLRSLFGGGARGDGGAGEGPPPYRHPPSCFPTHRAPITNSHFAADKVAAGPSPGRASERLSAETTSSEHGEEESYV
ncbi:uncharacterized protein [Hetaerina americana]|uniref:uncharacterized protein n=1 Tax=Hetaerina americana TaxID=62018 RepID=UPI003A7F1A6F